MKFGLMVWSMSYFCPIFKGYYFHCRLLTISSVESTADSVINKWMFYKIKKCIPLEDKRSQVVTENVIWSMCMHVHVCVRICVEVLDNFIQCFLGCQLSCFLREDYFGLFCRLSSLNIKIPYQRQCCGILLSYPLVMSYISWTAGKQVMEKHLQQFRCKWFPSENYTLYD